MAFRHKTLFNLALLACAMAAHSNAATVYRESVSGDLSNSGTAPTVLPVSSGSNQIFGSTGRGAAGTDRDYFTITVPTGLAISQILELGGTSVGDAVSFFGIERGSQVTVATNATTADGLLGWAHYGPVSTDTDIMPDLSVASLGSTGFTGPLGAGNYAFCIQDFGAGTFSYAFDVRLAAATPTAAPEPSSYALGLIGTSLMALVVRRARRSHS
jgi:hypothetical protein